MAVKEEHGGESNDIWLFIIIGFVVLGITVLGLSSYFDKLSNFTGGLPSRLLLIWEWITNPHLWTTLGIISSSFSVFFIGVIIFSIIRMRESQLHEKQELDHEIREALTRDKEAEKNENPRWHYILTLIESSNESDWRVAIIEADTMLDEILANKGMFGDTLSQKLEQARSNGYASIQSAWDAHLIRNQIAHQGSNYALSQIEGRRVIRLYQNFFEELNVV